MALVTLAQVKKHLLIADSDHDADVWLKETQAEAIILDYLKDRTDLSDWTDDLTVPSVVQASILLMVAHLYENRGDNSVGTIGGTTPDAAIWKAIDLLLARYRTPALA